MWLVILCNTHSRRIRRRKTNTHLRFNIAAADNLAIQGVRPWADTKLTPHVLYSSNICEILLYNRQLVVITHELICSVWAAHRSGEIVLKQDYSVATAQSEREVTVHGSEFLTFMVRHDDVIKWKHFPFYWPFVRGIHRSPVDSLTEALSFDVFFDLRLNERLNKQSRCQWSETPSRSLWRHCNDNGDVIF